MVYTCFCRAAKGGAQSSLTLAASHVCLARVRWWVMANSSRNGRLGSVAPSSLVPDRKALRGSASTESLSGDSVSRTSIEAAETIYFGLYTSNKTNDRRSQNLGQMHLGGGTRKSYSLFHDISVRRCATGFVGKHFILDVVWPGRL